MTVALACPFCGSGAGLKLMSMPATPAEREKLRRFFSHAVICTVCKAIGPRCGDQEAAATAWNTRL